MSRPTYERESDRARARRIISRTAEALGLGEPFEMPAFAPYDFALLPVIGNAVVGFAEVEARDYHSMNFATYFVGLDKWQSLALLHRATGLPVLLVLGFTDGVRFASVEELLPFVTFETGGRSDRNDPADSTVVAHFPRERFRHPTEPGANPFLRQ